MNRPLADDPGPGATFSLSRTLTREDVALIEALAGGGALPAASRQAIWSANLVAGLLAPETSGKAYRLAAQRLVLREAPAFGETLTVTARVTAGEPASSLLTLACTAVDAHGTTVFDGELEVTVDRDAAAASPTLPGLALGAGARRLLEHVRPLGAIRAAVVHPCDALSLSAALDARDAGLIEPVLVAPRARLEAAAAEGGHDLAGIEIVEAPHSHAAADLAAALAGRGEVEALVKGSLHTDELMRAVLAPEAGLRTGRRTSHCFLMQTPLYPRPFIITDAAVNIAPGLAEKADIVRNAIELAHAIGVARPRVAILAAVETVNPAMPATLDAAALCKMADRGQIAGGILDGPLALDNAVSAAAAKVKGIESEVAGRADILVVPDLESGNLLAKQLEYLGNAASAGIVLGARVPIVLTSRADSRESRLASAAVAVLLAHRYRTTPP